MANAVPRHLVLLAKGIGGYIALILPFLISVLISLLFAQLTTSLLFTAEEWAALGGIFAVAALYISVFFALGMLISTLVHRAATSLVINFLIWVLLVLVVPNTAPIVARALAPVPSVGVLAGRRQAIRREVWNGIRRKMRQAENNEARQQIFDDAQTQIREETDKVVADYLQKVDNQIALGIFLARISPSASYVYATAGLAASGMPDFAGLREYVKRYRREFMTKMQGIEGVRRQQAESAADASERQEIMEAPIDPKELPEFAPGRPQLAEILTDVQTDLLILVLLNVAFFLGAYMGFLRYDLMK